MRPLFVVLVGFLMLFGTCAVCISLGSKHEPAGSAAAPSAPPESDHDHLLRTAKSDGPYGAQQAIEKFLKAPSQAKFSDEELIEQNENFVLVSATVDAPNSFGVMLRQKWCAVLRFEPPRGDNFMWDKSTGAWNCERGVDADGMLRLRKSLVGWATAEETAAPKKRTRRTSAPSPQ